ncbi:ABC transporter substrate-binding protein [Sporichthya polymorpha]|uniref:ABC transporter substrate-binding protein n=1 Tax=Sporichthya polymorpha TaxID=35751 RepID=UPI00035D1577|nr:ABC transporter substrate-binding protein [Sporichthya polymorpha]
MRTRPSATTKRPSLWLRATAVTTAVLIVGSGCGSRASDTEIAEALRGPSTTGAAGAATVDTSAAGPVGSVAAPAVPDAAAAPGSTTAGSKAGKPAAGVTPGGAATPSSAAAPAATAPKVADKSEVKIGMLGPWSGVLGAVTASAPKTLQAWVANQNAKGGLNGHPIKLIVADDQGDPATTLTLARRLVESDKILAMAGNINLFGFPQLESYMRSKNVPMLGDGIDPGWYSSPVSFPVTSHLGDQILAGLQLLVSSGTSKMGMLYCLEVAALCTYFRDKTLASPMGKYIVQNYQVSLVAPSYTSQCLRMKQANIDAIYLLMDTAGAARLVQDCAVQGFRPKVMLLGLDATKDMPTIPALKDTLVPGATASPATGQGLPAVENYRRAMATYGPTVGESGTGMLAWVAGEMLALAGKNLPAAPTSADLFAGLWTVKNETLGGLTVPLTYAKGKNAVAKPCTFLWGVANNKFSAPQGAKLFC